MQKYICCVCQSLLEYKDINVKTNTAVCSQCSTVMDLTQLKLSQVDTKYKHNLQGPIDGITEIRDGSNYTIEVDWRSFSNYKFNLGFGLAILPLMLVMFFVFVSNAEIMGALILIPFVLVGGYLVYTGIAQYVNKSIFHFEDGSLTVHQYPLSLHNSERLIPMDKIDQVYVRRLDAGSKGDTKYYKHELLIKIQGEKDYKCISLFKDADEAYYLERLIESHLGIEDQLVETEYKVGDQPYKPEIQDLAKLLASNL